MTTIAASSPTLENVKPEIGPMTKRATGNTNAAASTPCIIPATIFSAAMSRVGTGARRRYSISFVQPKSCTIGSATDWIADKLKLTARIPGKSAV